MAGTRVVFIYANRLNPARDAFSEIASDYDSARREYVVDSSSVKEEDVSLEYVEKRVALICAHAHSLGEKRKIVLAGYSPLVALVYEAAKAFGEETVYFIRDSQTHKFKEIQVSAGPSKPLSSRTP